MVVDLWSKLKRYSEQNWLWNGIESDRNEAIALEQLTKYKAQKIASLVAANPHKLNIIVAESEPLEFLAAFLAGISQNVNLFLGNPDWQQPEWQQVITLVKPDAIFATTIVKDLIINASHLNLSNSESSPIDCPHTIPSLIMIPTGGSSGKIKFAIHNWSTLEASVLGFQTYFNCNSINSFCTLPLYHVSGLMQFMRSFLSLGNLIICPYQLLKTTTINCDPRDFFISLVPTQLQLLIELIPDWLAEFKTILLGGAPASRKLLEQARQHQLPLAATYGMTETASQIVTLKPQDFLAGNYSNGRVLPHAEVTIQPQSALDINSKIGLIQIRSHALCWGYYPQFFKERNLFTTDDLGYFDEAGYLHLVGRNSQKIITGGENVFPGEVETAILATKLVADVCVIGISDRHWGEAVTAVYVSFKDKQTIPSQIQLPLAKYKHPKHWIEVTSLERNDRGKIDYAKLKAIAIEKLRKITNY